MKPDWMSQEDWNMSRFENAKENIRVGGKMIDQQTIRLEIHQVKCTSGLCGRTFFEEESLKFCPHCAGIIDDTNIGKPVIREFTLNTRTGAIGPAHIPTSPTTRS